MKTLNCDICKADITNAISGRTYFHIAHRDVCESCRDRLEYQIKPVARSKTPFSYDWYGKMYQDNIEKAIQKGKVDVKVVI
ncbi:MAG: hypothetical protein FWH19_05595 [Treponema sp.]|nr:hypothetical protein [Treponema sp.]